MRLLLHSCYYVTVFQKRAVPLQAITALIFKSKQIFGSFGPVLASNHFSVRARTFRPVYNSETDNQINESGLVRMDACDRKK